MFGWLTVFGRHRETVDTPPETHRNIHEHTQNALPPSSVDEQRSNTLITHRCATEHPTAPEVWALC